MRRGADPHPLVRLAPGEGGPWRGRVRLHRPLGALVAYLVESLDITGGWFWQACFPGCLPDGPPDGPYATYADAKAAAQECAE